MFDRLFPPSCPCDPAAKAWVEERLEWLAEEFPGGAFRGGPIILPTPEWFPDRYDRSWRAVRRMLDRVCGYMDVIPDLVELRIKNELGRSVSFVNDQGHELPGAAGTFEEGARRYILRIDAAMLGEPMHLVGTLAHELAHVRLMGKSRVIGNEFDNELLTDLTVVFFGLGIFVANGPTDWRGHDSTWPGTKLRRPEYLSPPMYGWALAHLAWFRGERHPA